MPYCAAFTNMARRWVSVADIIKTWPAFMDRRKVEKIFKSPWGMFYFVVGKGKPKQAIDRLWFTHQDEVLGNFKVQEIVCNVGQLPKLRSLENRESEWQIKPDRYVAICPGPMEWLAGDVIYYGSFRGFRYFDFDAYSKTMEAKIAL